MELFQSQAPIDWELFGSSASARHGTFDIWHLTLDIRHGTWDIGIWKYWREVIFRGDKIRLKHFPKIGIFSKYSNDLDLTLTWTWSLTTFLLLKAENSWPHLWYILLHNPVPLWLWNILLNYVNCIYHVYFRGCKLLTINLSL